MSRRLMLAKSRGSIPADGLVFYAGLHQADARLSGDVEFAAVDGVPCAVFDGTSRLVTSEPYDDFALGSTLTVALWAKNHVPASNEPYIMLSISDPQRKIFEEFTIAARGNLGYVNAIAIGNNGADVYAPNNSLPVNEWHHIAAVVDNGEWHIFRDGVKIAQGRSSMFNVRCRQLAIGGVRFDDSEAVWNGCICGVAIYDRALNDQEIMALKNASRN